MYLRLLIPHLLPDWFGRVLYIDGDVLVVGDLSSLCSLEMGGAPVMAVENFSEPTLGTAMPQLLHLIGASPDAPYFNSGVLLIDLPRWREERVSERTLEFLRAHKDQVVYPDQDALNAVLAGRWRKLDPVYNVQLLTLSHFGHREHAPRERRRRQSALLSGAKILHYIGRRKPWHLLYGQKAGGTYLRIAAESGWFGTPKKQIWRLSRAAGHLSFYGIRAVKRLIAISGRS
jgi:lipopolysaccharide biosynthesis glycosyltransferase